MIWLGVSDILDLLLKSLILLGLLGISFCCGMLFGKWIERKRIRDTTLNMRGEQW